MRYNMCKKCKGFCCAFNGKFTKDGSLGVCCWVLPDEAKKIAEHLGHSEFYIPPEKDEVFGRMLLPKKGVCYLMTPKGCVDHLKPLDCKMYPYDLMKLRNGEVWLVRMISICNNVWIEDPKEVEYVKKLIEPYIDAYGNEEECSLEGTYKYIEQIR